jgi:hypothetical protein
MDDRRSVRSELKTIERPDPVAKKVGAPPPPEVNTEDEFSRR